MQDESVNYDVALVEMIQFSPYMREKSSNENIMKCFTRFPLNLKFRFIGNE